MEPIYYRGMTIDTNEWCYGAFLPTPSGGYGYITRHYYSEYDTVDKNIVNLKTVTKTSPYHDSSLHRIFEYDIVEFKDKKNYPIAKAVLFRDFLKGVEKWTFKNLDARSTVNVERCIEDPDIRYFVVGNIYDTTIDAKILLRIYRFVAHKMLVEYGFIEGREYRIFNDGVRTHVYVSISENTLKSFDYEDLIDESVKSDNCTYYCGNSWWNEEVDRHSYCVGWVYETLKYLDSNIDSNDDLSREEITETNERIKEDIKRACETLDKLESKL